MNNLHSKINMKNVLWGIEKSYGRLTDLMVKICDVLLYFLIFLTMFSTIFMEMISKLCSMIKIK